MGRRTSFVSQKLELLEVAVVALPGSSLLWRSSEAAGYSANAVGKECSVRKEAISQRTMRILHGRYLYIVLPVTPFQLLAPTAFCAWPICLWSFEYGENGGQRAPALESGRVWL